MKANPYAPSSQMNSVSKRSECTFRSNKENELEGLKKFLAEIQGMSRQPTPSKNEVNARHLCGVSPTNYRQQHVSSMKLNKIFTADDAEEEPIVRCFQEIADEESEHENLKVKAEIQDNSFVKPLSENCFQSDTANSFGAHEHFEQKSTEYPEQRPVQRPRER